MNGEQLFVGGVSALLGLIALLAAISNREGFYRLPKADWIQRRWGRGAARAAFAILGMALILLGMAIALSLGRTGNG